MIVRPARASDAAAWVRMRTALWPEQPDDHPREVASYLEKPPERWTCLLAEGSGGEVLGFAEVGLRDFAEGCTTSPVGYLEGVWVEARVRGSGVGRALLKAGSAWARARGCTEMASDRSIDNEESGGFHLAVGFEEAGAVVCYRLELAPRGSKAERAGEEADE